MIIILLTFSHLKLGNNKKNNVHIHHRLPQWKPIFTLQQGLIWYGVHDQKCKSH